MKKIILLALLLSQISFAGFINPMKFDGSEKQKKEVIEYIKQNTKEQLELIGTYSKQMARMMEEEQLNDFKELTKADNKEAMNTVISQLKLINNLNYTMIKLMYEEEVKAGEEELTW